MIEEFGFKNYSVSTFILFGIFCGTVVNSFMYIADYQSSMDWLLACIGAGVIMNLSAMEDRIMFKLDNK